jgi:hypothetical protein
VIENGVFVCYDLLQHKVTAVDLRKTTLQELPCNITATRSWGEVMCQGSVIPREVFRTKRSI